MHTIQLNINDSEFEETKAYLHQVYADMLDGKAEFYSIEELEKEMDELIAKYEKNLV